MRPLMLLAIAATVSALPLGQDAERVDMQLLTTYQRLEPAGWSLQVAGRPVDLALSEDGRHLWVKDSTGLRVVQVDGWKEVASNATEGGTSLAGLEVFGDVAYATNSQNSVLKFRFNDGKIESLGAVVVPGPDGKAASFLCGLALTKDGETAYVCASRNNTVVRIDALGDEVLREIPVGVAPFDLVVLANEVLVVSNQGGHRPSPGALTAPSAGTETEVDERGVASTGTVSVVDGMSGRLIKEIEVGLQPSGLVAGKDWVAVANANSDSVSFISTKTWSVVNTLVIKPEDSLPFGSMPNALELSGDGKTMFVALAGSNAVAIVDVRDVRKARVKGFVPTGWFPGAVIADKGTLYVANIKGVGSRTVRRDPEKGWNSHDHAGTVQKFIYPTAEELSAYSSKVRELDRVPHILSMLERKGASSTSPVAVPAKLGDPSTIEHVIYIIKENRTYDQFFGDIEKGSGEPSLCVFPRDITPNHHALAEEFVLLDNYYCEGVLSADGHSWATEGNVTPYLERAFGGFSRSYTFGDDPITYSSTGFIWDHVLAGGLSFRNFGEMDTAEPPSGWKVDSVWRNYAKGQNVTFAQTIGIEKLRRYSSREFPGWNMAIPDVLRADRFLTEFREMERTGSMPNFMIIYLPQDHGAGTTPGYPTMASYMADNDLALGRIVEAVSNSKFWPKTVIFANEDDPQAGFDHVDGHRSICLVVSPWTRGGKVVSKFYNQNSVLHTALRIFGLPPMNAQNARAPIMFDCFNPVADLTPFAIREPGVDMNAVNPPLSALKGDALKFARLSMKQDLDDPDEADEDELNRIIWFAMKGSVPYPTEWAGAHGRGLKERGLSFEDKKQPSRR